jgi:Ion transport protein
MTILDDTTRNDRTARTYNTYNHQDGEKFYGLGQRSALLGKYSRRSTRTRFFQQMSPRWIPGDLEDETPGSAFASADGQIVSERHRSLGRRFFLFLTEPDTSFGSALFFFVLIVAIILSNVIMVMQTMDSFQYTPNDCRICGGDAVYMFDDDTSVANSGSHACVCPPQPFRYLQSIVDYLLYFFAVEWTLRVVCYSPADPNRGVIGQFGQWLGFLFSTSTLIDALAIWPYFFESLPKGLVSLRLLRLFRVFQLVRLGKYNKMFMSLSKVLQKSVEYLKLMVLMLLFGAAFFGSILYWLEQGKWRYWEPTGDFQYIRMSKNGVDEEISPFRSIPVSFWWFIVTATTVGYGGEETTTEA